MWLNIIEFPAYYDIAQHEEETTRGIQLLSSSKLNLRVVISKLKVSADELVYLNVQLAK